MNENLEINNLETGSIICCIYLYALIIMWLIMLISIYSWWLDLAPGKFRMVIALLLIFVIGFLFWRTISSALGLLYFLALKKKYPDEMKNVEFLKNVVWCYGIVAIVFVLSAIVHLVVIIVKNEDKNVLSHVV